MCDLLDKIDKGTIKVSDNILIDNYDKYNGPVINNDNIILCGASFNYFDHIGLSEDKKTLITYGLPDKNDGLWRIDMYFLSRDLFDSLMSLTIKNIGFNLHDNSFDESTQKQYPVNIKLSEILKVGGFLTRSLVECINDALLVREDIVTLVENYKKETGAKSKYHNIDAFIGSEGCDILKSLKNGKLKNGDNFDFSFYFEYIIGAKVQYSPPNGFKLRERGDKTTWGDNCISYRVVSSGFGDDDACFYEQIWLTFRDFKEIAKSIHDKIGDYSGVQSEIRVAELNDRKIENIDFKYEFTDGYTLKVLCDPRSELVESYVLRVNIDPDKTMGVDNGDFKRSDDVEICVKPEDIKTENDFKNFISRQEFKIGKKIPVDKILNVFESHWDNAKWKQVSGGAFSKDRLKDDAYFNIVLDKKYAVDEGFIVGGVDNGKGEDKNSKEKRLPKAPFGLDLPGSKCCCSGKCCTCCMKNK